MYKATQEKTDHIERVGSAATRPSARGIIRDIPEWAQKPEEYYNSVLDAFQIANKQVFALRSRAAFLRLRIKTGQATPGETREYHDDLRPVLERMESEIDQLRHAVMAASTSSWAAIFYGVARQMLEDDAFAAINSVVRDILGRDKTPQNLGRKVVPQTKAEKKTLRKEITLARKTPWP